MEFIETLVHYAIIIAEVAFALGLVIFVHELGHFLVAKLCGVKCEKFYLGFDVYGLKLCKFQWGETEYGIGALPLGGYVKMLGQDDNPSKAYEEMQRAKIATGDANATSTSAASEDGTETTALDPRSYMAQSVPKRMAIISAGVVMNLIFAFIFAVLAYKVGVQDNPAVISGVVPGKPAWKAGLRPDDKIVQVGDNPTPYFSDLMQRVMLGDFPQGLKIDIERPGSEPFSVTLFPDDKLRRVPSIGVQGPSTTRLIKAEEWSERKPVREDTAAAAAQPAFQSEDEIVAIGDVPIKSYADLSREMARNADKPVKVQVRRKAAAADAKSTAGGEASPGELVTIELPTAPILDYGMAMKAGPVNEIQTGSPAEGKLQIGDEIVSVGGEPLADPMRLPAQLDRRAGEKIVLQVKRPGVDQPVDVELELRAPLDYDWPAVPGGRMPVLGIPLGVPSAGFTFTVSNQVASVTPGGPADAMLIKPGDEITSVSIATPVEPSMFRLRKPQPDVIPLSAEKPNWPLILGLSQSLPKGATIEFTVARPGEPAKKVAINPVAASDWFNPDRGLNLAPAIATHQAQTLGEAVSLGFDKTKDNVLLVYRFLRKLKEGQVPVAAIGGPVEIAKQAGASASAGLPHLLMFLVMLSANLAVINFLPIPLLDGGHMVFLILEAIRRKPVSERVVVAFHYAGFVFLISLMCFVLFLDLGGRAWLWKP